MKRKITQYLNIFINVKFFRVTSLKLKHTVLKGFNTVKIDTINIDLCLMTFIIEFIIPKLEITTMYTLEGYINGTSISGDGHFT